MAQYIGYLQGNRSQISRLGSKSSGIVAKAQGWKIGAEIIIRHNEKTGKDEVRIIKTGGSNARIEPELIIKFTE